MHLQNRPQNFSEFNPNCSTNISPQFPPQKMTRSSKHFVFSFFLSFGVRDIQISSSKCFDRVESSPTPLINVVACIISLQLDMNQETILTTTSTSPSLPKQRLHSMECAVHPLQNTTRVHMGMTSQGKDKATTLKQRHV